MMFFARNSITLIAAVLILYQYESVIAFHASLPNRASMIQKQKRDDEGGVDVIIMLRAAAISAQEAAERMQKLQQADRAAMEQEQPPMLFDDDLIDEMNAAYMTLEKRIQDGPGSLSTTEIDQLESRLRRIITEMKLNEHKRPTKQSATTNTATPAEPQQGPILNENPFPQQQSTPSSFQQSAPNVIPNQRVVLDTSLDEGPLYDGTGGMGQPRGTVNTYAIEGMEEMTSEEYMKALQDRVINTQRERRRTGRAGNHGSWSYLNALSGKTEGILNKKD